MEWDLQSEFFSSSVFAFLFPVSQLVFRGLKLELVYVILLPECSSLLPSPHHTSKKRTPSSFSHSKLTFFPFSTSLASSQTQADIGIKNHLIVGVGKAGNADTMQGVNDELCVGVNTEVVAGEKLIVTAGAIDAHGTLYTLIGYDSRGEREEWAK